MNQRACVVKMVKPNSKIPTKLVDSVETTLQNPTLKNMLVSVKDKSSFSENTTTTTPEQGVKKGCGRSKLYEICAANHWKPPVFECCKEEGPCHCIIVLYVWYHGEYVRITVILQKLQSIAFGKLRFTFKVIIEIKIGKASKNVEISEKSKNIIEVYGAPHQKKKMAADDAAEGALWYLKHIGFHLKNK